MVVDTGVSYEIVLIPVLMTKLRNCLNLGDLVQQSY